MLFYCLVNPTGNSVSTSYLISSDANSIEQGGTYTPITYNPPSSGNSLTFNLKYGHIYQIEYCMQGATILNLAAIPTVPLGTITTHKTTAGSASNTANAYVRCFQATTTNTQLDQVCTVTLSATTITTCSFVSFILFDFGSTFNPSNPVPAPGEPQSKWLQSKDNKQNLANQSIQTELRLLKKQVEMLQQEQRRDPWDDNCEEDFEVEATPAMTPTKGVQRLSKCYYCDQQNPDHIGRNCPSYRSVSRGTSLSPSRQKDNNNIN